MCDYSLHGIKNRLAFDGEQLFVNTFHTSSKGLAAVADFNSLKTVRPAPAGTGFFGRIAHRVREAQRVVSGQESYYLPAICVPPGAKLMLSGIPLGARQELDVDEVEEVTFVQLTFEPFRYRDAFKFANGRTQLVQLFHEGLRVEVLSLELEEKAVEIPAEREVSANVR